MRQVLHCGRAGPPGLTGVNRRRVLHCRHQFDTSLNKCLEGK